MPVATPETGVVTVSDVPTYDITARFLAEYGRLSPTEQAMFERARRLFVDGLRAGNFHPRLRVKRFKSLPGVWEMSWGPDGRALWRYGEPILGKPGPHVVWLRIGDHKIFDRP